jgi:predicted GH43/DUF377 family glycosyl hydrolase
VSDDEALVRRQSQILRPDPRRVITKLFLPGQEMLARGISRADAVVQRVLAMTDDQVTQTLALTIARFGTRHPDLPATLAEHFTRIEHRIPPDAQPSAQRRDLIGAVFTQEYSVESAALFNPSMVAHPDQTGLEPGQLRFIMSVRAVGEGHISSLEFRTGVIEADGAVLVDEPGPHLATGRPHPAKMSRLFLREALAERAEAAEIDHLLDLLPARFGADDLDSALQSVRRDQLTRGSADALLDRIRWIAACNYVLDFPPGLLLSERVIYPSGADESHGIEDARLTRFVEDDGGVTYFGTYTAYDGAHVAPHLLRTSNFRTFEMTQLVGPAARDKGMALFPRRVGGAYLALSRSDRETNGIASSPDARSWQSAVTFQAPQQPWEVIQLGNCGPPLETPEGWLVLTHGVGPVRTYGISAVLLDLEDPAKLIGALDQPLLTPSEDEREGYVPNVVYSCGALLHGQVLVLPYGCSDSSIRFACIGLPELMTRLTAGH